MTTIVFVKLLRFLFPLSPNRQNKLDEEHDSQRDQDNHLPELIRNERQPGAEEHTAQIELYLPDRTIKLLGESALIFMSRPERHGEDSQEPGEGEDPDGV